MFDIADKAFTTWVTQKSARTSFFGVITPNDNWALRSREDASAIERLSTIDGSATRLRRETTFHAPQSGWCAPSRRLQEVGLGDSYSASNHASPIIRIIASMYPHAIPTISRHRYEPVGFR